ncbi:chemokine XC receptor 1 [Pelobates cultripes]|uniref:Chemokine XC receptor 1 n=1 Tax=Pelobates cultripes TaxID=61616 RepID=A0AAD1W3S0_PELCU|nr:chemokine XC receptor 1 [Pelobates cultripes]
MYEMENITDITGISDYYMWEQACDKEDVSAFATLLTTILNSFIFIFSIIGNGLVLWVLIAYENFESVTNVFIFNLSIADLILTLCLPFFIVYHRQGWIFGAVACKTFNALFSVGFYSGIIFLTFMTYHRYLAVVDPLSALKTRRPAFKIMTSIIAWFLSISASVPVIIFQVETKYAGFNRCEYNEKIPELVSNYQQNIFFLITFSVIIFCYFNIIKTLLKSQSQRNHKPVKLILVIVVVYFLSWSPYNIIMLIHSLNQQNIFKDCEFIKKIDYAKYVSEKIAMSHCCLNPILYAFVGIKFRRHLKNVLKCCCQCKHDALSTARHSSQYHCHNEDGSLY